MTTWLAGTEESTIVQEGGGLPGRGTLPGRGASASGTRGPAGTWHAVDADTRRPACGTSRFLEVWADHPWGEATDADRCPECVAVAG
jgi:hypothetical protein